MSVVTFPLALGDFFDLLPIRSASQDCPENAVTSITGGGEVIRATLAPQLWRGTVELAPRHHGEAARIAALLDLIQRPGASFLAYDKRLPGPQSGGSTGNLIRLNSINADNRRLALENLPAGYVLQRGDYIAFTYGSPSKCALHRVVPATVTASSGLVAGITGEFEVTPLIRPGAAVNDPVTIVKAPFKAVLVPGSLSTGSGQRTITSGMSFSFVQTLR